MRKRPARWTATTALLLAGWTALHAGIARAATRLPTPAAPPAAMRPTSAGVAPSAAPASTNGLSAALPLMWHPNLESALMLASVDYQPVLVLFSSPDCSWCRRLKTGVLEDPAIKGLLQRFALAEVDITEDEQAAFQYQVRGVPTLLVLSSDGRVRGGAAGFIARDELRALLEQSLNPQLLRKSDDAYTQLLGMLDEGDVPAEKWPEAMAFMGHKDKRQELHDRLLQLSPFPREQVTALLGDHRIAVRLGALELLEELAGESFGFDPWLGTGSEAANAEALAAWNAWAEASGGGVTNAYSGLTAEQITAYIQDLVSQDRDRSLRAKRMLEHGGNDSAHALAAFLADDPDLPEGARRKVREVQYALWLPSTAGIDPVTLAHQLVFGTLDMRLKSLALLQGAGRQAIPLLKEFLEDADPIVRETAVDALIAAAGRDAVAPLDEHLARERDVDVIHTVLRGLGRVRSKSSLKVLGRFLENPNEDLVIASLTSMAKLESKTVSDELRKATKDERWRVRVAALDAAGKLKLSALADDIGAMLRDPDAFVRYSAVKALTAISAKKAASELEAAFLREDELKGPVVDAFCRMDLRLPESIQKGLEGATPEILLSVIESLESCNILDLALPDRFIDHEDLDVACAAIRLIGDKGMALPRYQTRMREVLATGQRAKVVAALESIDMDDEVLASHQMQLASWFREPDDEPDVAAPVSDALADLFDAFLDDGPEGTPPATAASNDTAAAVTNHITNGPAPAQGAAGDAGEVSAEDVFAAFFDDEPTATETGRTERGTVSGWDGFAELIAAVEALLGPEQEDDIRFKAALLLAGIGNPVAVPVLREGLPGRTADQRQEIATHLAKVVRKDSIPLLKDLLADASPSVRKAAAEACLSHSSAAFTDIVFEEFMREGAKLLPHEVYGYRIENATRQPARKRAIRKWAIRLLEESSDPALLNFALIVLEKCWRRSDAERVEPFLTSDDPYQRRAAYHALGKGSQDAFRKRLSQVVKDPSELVRAVVPQVFAMGGSSWLHYFDATHFDNDHYYWHASYGGTRETLAPDVVAALRDLTNDTSLKVRIEAFFCLLFGRQTVDLARFVGTVDLLADRKTVAERVGDYLADNYSKLGQSFKILVPYLEESRRDADVQDKVRQYFHVDADEPPPVAIRRSEEAAPILATFVDAPDPVAQGAADRPLKLVYFTSPGCADCDRVEALLPELGEFFPSLEVRTYNIKKVAAMRLNEALCGRFGVPDAIRLVAPAAFCDAGYLIKDDITFAKLGELLSRSTPESDSDRLAIPDEELAVAEAAIGSRYSALGIGVVLLAGALDGVNPCAFATIIFFLSYLQITRRRPREIAQVGAAFVVGVFLAYFALGLGLVEIIDKLQALRLVTQILNGVIAAFAFAIMVLSIRDGVLCLRGRVKDMALQLPQFLKTRIHGAVRTGARHRRFVIAAFGTGVVISILELACTGQVYAPTILFMLRTGRDLRGALTYLTLYNLAFIAPLVAIFAFACYGLKSEALTVRLQKHAALVKFSTAALFLALFLFFIWTGYSHYLHAIR